MKHVSVTEVPAGAQLIDVREPDEYAAVRAEGLTYGHFMHGLKLAGVDLGVVLTDTSSRIWRVGVTAAVLTGRVRDKLGV